MIAVESAANAFRSFVVAGHVVVIPEFEMANRTNPGLLDNLAM